MNNHDLTVLVKTFDPAPRAELDEPARQRAAAGRDRILATAVPQQPAPGRARTPRRWAIPVAALAAASVAGLIAVDALAPVPAYATWSPNPTAVSSDERAIAAAACTDAMRQPATEVVLAERRGDWVALAAVTDVPGTLSCILYLPKGATRAEHVMAGASGGQGAVPSGGEFTEGSISEFAEMGFLGISSSPPAAFNIGDVGPEVAAVDVTTADGDVVHATVQDGRFIAWWPGRAFGDEKEGNGGPAPDLAYRITLRDGTVIEDAEPVVP